MMKLSTRSTYGLRAALALAVQHGAAPVTVAALAEENQIPRRYLEQILNRLRRRGLVVALRGPRGGYSLALEPARITVGDIVRAVEGDLEPVLCTFPEMKTTDCRMAVGCVSQTFCLEMERNLSRILEGTSLEDLRNETLRRQATPGQGPAPMELVLGVVSGDAKS